MKDLGTRLISAAVLLAIVAVALIGRGWYAALILAVFALLGAFELDALFGKCSAPPLRFVLYPITAVLVLRAVLPHPEEIVDLVIAATFVIGLTAIVTTRSHILGWVTALGAAIYVGYPLGYYALLLDAHRGGDLFFGSWIVLIAAGSVVACDTCAYFVGTAFGRHPFMPDLSPKKSKEGAAAGLVGAVLVSGIAFHIVVGLALPAAIALGVAIGVAAQVGDLAESALKRHAGVKDSGALIPGHGGMLDRLDSLVIVAPVVYWYLRLFGVV